MATGKEKENLHLLLLFKVTAWLVSAASLYLLIRIIKSGMALTSYREKRREDWYYRALGGHERETGLLLGITMAAVIAVKIFGRFLPEIHKHPPIFPVHLYGFAIESLLSMAILWIFLRGDRYPRLHHWLAHLCVFWTFGSSVLGAYLAYLM